MFMNASFKHVEKVYMFCLTHRPTKLCPLWKFQRQLQTALLLCTTMQTWNVWWGCKCFSSFSGTACLSVLCSVGLDSWGWGFEVLYSSPSIVARVSVCPLFLQRRRSTYDSCSECCAIVLFCEDASLVSCGNVACLRGCRRDLLEELYAMISAVVDIRVWV